MHLEMHVIILCLVTVVCADRSAIDLAKCQRNDDNNCEQFSFRQKSQNFSNAAAAANRSIETKNGKSVDVIENQVVFKESTNEEDGNFLVFNCNSEINKIIK